MWKRATLMTFTILVTMSAAAGCLGNFGGNNSSSDGGAGSGSGGAAVYFDPDVQTTMDSLGCSASDCHGDPATPMHVVALAQGGKVDANYSEVVARTQGGASSLLLSKPVDGVMLMHDGGKLFAQRSTTYQQWMAWIKAGAPLRAPAAGGAPAPAGGDMGASMPPAAAGDMGPCVAVTPTTMSSHNAGQECLSCHMTNPDLTLRFTLAGTLYMDSFGTTPRGGATVTITDAKGITVPLVSDVEGNFFTTKALTFPVAVSASACPSTMAMMGKPANGACNASGCHDAKQPAYLP